MENELLVSAGSLEVRFQSSTEPRITLTLHRSRRGARISLSNGPFPFRNRDSLSFPRQSVIFAPLTLAHLSP
jgi:hypothetical protein